MTAAKSICRAFGWESLRRNEWMSCFVCQKCISWCLSSLRRFPRPIVEVPNVSISHKKVFYRITGFTNLYWEWPRTISHFSSSTVNWRHRSRPISKQKWIICRLCCDNLGCIQILQILNMLDNGDTRTKLALLRDFLLWLEKPFGYLWLLQLRRYLTHG